jgi:uncharacterized protein (TIGR03067 family)
MPSDQQAIQGLWRLVSCVARGGPVGTAATHYQFDGNRVKEIDPSRVDGGNWATFELDPKARPKRFTKISEWAGKGGKPVRRIDRWLYDVNGDTLRLCWPSVFGDYPDALSDQSHGVITLARDPGPPPKTKQPAGKKPIEDPVLGQLTWDDNYDWWEAQVKLKPERAVDVHVEPADEQDDVTAVAGGREFIRWLRRHEPAARRFAAAELLDTHNGAWNEGEPISARGFADRMTLESVGIDADGGASLYYHDGDLFWGHCIIVSVGADRAFRNATIAG